jgi:protein ImuB
MAPFRYFAVFSADPKRLHEAADMLAPHSEVYPPDGLILRVPVRYEQDTLNRLTHLGDRSLRIGGASTRTAAILAARARPGTIVPFGRESEFLGSLPIGILKVLRDIDGSLLDTIDGWGVRTLGELAALPEKALAARLGKGGPFLRRLARGEDPYCLPALRPDPEFRESRDLEWTIDLLEPLVFLLGGMLATLCSRLGECGMAVESLDVALKLTDRSVFERTVKPALPMEDPKAILSLVRLDLQAHPPAAAVRGITLRARPCRPRRFQHSLLQPAAPHPEKLARTLTRLQALMGEQNVGVPRLLDTHRSDAFRLEPPRLDDKAEAHGGLPSGDSAGPSLSLRRLRPPQPTELCNERIVSCAGPWRSSGDWWAGGEHSDAWSRDEWDVEYTDGGIYRVYWDHRLKGWFVDGVYD